MIKTETLLNIVVQMQKETNLLDPEKIGVHSFCHNYEKLKTNLKRLSLPKSIVMPVVMFDIPEEKLFSLLPLEFLILPENKVKLDNFIETFNTNWSLYNKPLVIRSEKISIVMIPFNYKVEIFILDNYSNDNDRVYVYNYFLNKLCPGNEINFGTSSLTYYEQFKEYLKDDILDPNDLRAYWAFVSEFDRQFSCEGFGTKNQFKLNSVFDDKIELEKKLLKAGLIISRLLDSGKIKMLFEV